MNLVDMGWSPFFESYFSDFLDTALVPARVVEELKGFYRVRSIEGQYLADVTGKIHYQAEDRDDFPAVGDWVALRQPADGAHHARIESILPRRTSLRRKAAGREFTEQLIATNLDTVFVVSSLNRDLNERRIERYLALVWESGARPVVLLNKADLCDDAASVRDEIEHIALSAPVHTLSALTGDGLEAVLPYLSQGHTAAFAGSSGVGKSTIINAILGSANQRVDRVREHDDRGQHTTTSRQMIFLPGGGIVIDTPGMRELGLWGSEKGITEAFDDIGRLSQLCRFRDCTHRGEPECAVETAIAAGELAGERLENHRKLQAELRYQECKADPRAARGQKEKWKKIHKAMRNKNRI